MPSAAAEMWREIHATKCPGPPLGVFLKEDAVNLKSIPRGSARVDFILTLGAVVSVPVLVPIGRLDTAIAVLVIVVIGLWIVSPVIISSWRTLRDVPLRFHALNRRLRFGCPETALCRFVVTVRGRS